MRTFAALLLFFIAASCFATCQNSEPQSLDSLATHCFDLPFLSVAASTPTRDYTPAIELLLVDSLGRSAGQPFKGKRIPDSSYGEIADLPYHPQIHSRALAVEVCNAKEGIYQIRVAEESSEKYRLEVIGNSPSAGTHDSLLLHHMAEKGRNLEYRFVFRTENHVLVLQWLDSKGREIPESQPIEVNNW